MTDEKSKGETTTGFYVGKEIAGEGDGAKGHWKRYKLKFKPSMDSAKSFSFTAFEGLKAKNSKQLNELVEGKAYKILFNKEERQGPSGPYESKTAFGIYEADGKAVAKTVKSTSSIQSPASVNISAFTPEWVEQYKAALSAAGVKPNPYHMLGSFLASKNKPLVGDLLNKCTEALK